MPVETRLPMGGHETLTHMPDRRLTGVRVSTRGSKSKLDTRRVSTSWQTSPPLFRRERQYVVSPATSRRMAQRKPAHDEGGRAFCSSFDLIHTYITPDLSSVQAFFREFRGPVLTPLRPARNRLLFTSTRKPSPIFDRAIGLQPLAGLVSRRGVQPGSDCL
jgi:hypothetical protein